MTNDRKVYIGNLPPNATTKDVEKLFSCFGKIIDIDIKNRNGPPFAFITFDDKRDAEDAIRDRDGYDLDGFSLRVEFPRELKQNYRKDYNYSRYDDNRYIPYNYNMCIPPFNYAPSYNQRQYFGDYRDRVFGGGGGGGGGRYRRNGPGMSQRRPRPPRSTDYRVCISNLPLHSNWQDLKDFMRRYGEVSYADVFANGNGVCDFVSKEDFRYVLKYVNNVKFKSTTGHSSYIKVEEDKIKKKGYQRRSTSCKSRSRSRSQSKSDSSKSSRSKSSFLSSSGSTKNDDDKKKEVND